MTEAPRSETYHWSPGWDLGSVQSGKSVAFSGAVTGIRLDTLEARIIPTGIYTVGDIFNYQKVLYKCVVNDGMTYLVPPTARCVVRTLVTDVLPSVPYAGPHSSHHPF